MLYIYNIIIFINFTHVLNQCLWAKTIKPQEQQGGILTGLGKSKTPLIPPLFGRTPTVNIVGNVLSAEKRCNYPGSGRVSRLVD